MATLAEITLSSANGLNRWLNAGQKLTGNKINEALTEMVGAFILISEMNIKKIKMNWTLFFTIGAAAFAFLSVIFQHLQKSKEEKELKVANATIMKLQDQIIKEIKGSDSIPELSANLSYGRDMIILRLNNKDTIPANNIKVLIERRDFEPVQTIVDNESDGIGHLDDYRVQEINKPFFVDKIAPEEFIIIYTCDLTKEVKGIFLLVYIYNKGNLQRYRVVYQNSIDNGPTLSLKPIRIY